MMSTTDEIKKSSRSPSPGPKIEEEEEEEEGPIDLSKNKSEIPPLIPINRKNIFKKRWIAENQTETKIDSMTTSKKRRAEDTDEDTWNFRLDRAHSVPHLRSLPPLIRCKSLSESRIVATLANNEPPTSSIINKPIDWLLEQEHELQRQRLQQMQIDLANYQSNDLDHRVNGYYAQILQCFQAQEMFQRRFHHQEDHESGVNTHEQEEVQVSGDEEKVPTDDMELRRRTNRPLTGKHVRSGTGASPATLLTLRKKIQARQQVKSDVPPK